MSSSSGRIYDERFARDQVKDEGPANLKDIEAAMALNTDLKKEVVNRPPTRMERKLTRIFGSGK